MAADAKLQAWFTFLQAHAAVTEGLGDELRERAGLAMSEYEVLLHLDRASGGKLRMADLAGSVLLTASGTTRAVDRMEREGLVHRAQDPDDGRATLVSLSPAGRRRFRAAAPVHLAGIRARFLDALTVREARELRSALSKVLEATGRPERRL
ncbi:MAG: MarR family winged helix-turn-helix transcriptional regulator [Actinomycetota bacterium]